MHYSEKTLILNNTFFFILLSHNTLQLQLFLPSIFPVPPLPSPSPTSIAPVSLQKRAVISAEHSTTTLGINPHIKVEQGNPVGGKESQDKAKESETSYSPCSTKPQAKNPLHAQIHAGSVVATSVSVSLS